MVIRMGKMAYYRHGYYGENFHTFPASVHPTKANVWATLKKVKAEYEEFCMECANNDQSPVPHWVYMGRPSGNEERYGYPDYPDYIITQGPKGGITVRKI